MRRFSSVVLLETLFEIGGCSHIAFTSRGATFNKIDVIHWPSFAEASEGVLLRANEHLSPAKRQVRSRAEGVRFELTRPFGLPVFKTGAINRSATPPEKLSLDFAIVSAIGNQLQIVGQALRLPFFGLAGEAPALQQNCSSTCGYVHVNLVHAAEQEIPTCRYGNATEPRSDSGARRVLEPSEPLRKIARRFNRRGRCRGRLRDRRDAAAPHPISSRRNEIDYYPQYQSGCRL